MEEFPDWAVNAAFYAKYHALLAILFKLGYESRNQECTITAVEYLIKNKTINFNQKYIEMIRRTSEAMPKDSKTLREEFQYGVKIKINKPLLQELKNNAIQFVEAVELLLKTIGSQLSENKGKIYMIKIKLLPIVGSFAENKDLARDSRIKKLIPALEDKQEATLDFEGIDSATQPFIHVLISDLIRKYGSEVLEKIYFKNCNKTIKKIINIVVEYMQERE